MSLCLPQQTYPNSYAEQMAKYGLQRGIEGSEAKHVATSPYYNYRDLPIQTESVQAEKELSSVKANIKKEKLKNSVVDVSAILLDGVGSLFRNFKTKQQQQQIQVLEADNRSLSDNIKNFNTKIKTMETKHKTAIDKLTKQLNQIYSLFPHVIKELLRWENLLKTIGLTDDMVWRLFNKEMVVESGELYSKEHSKRSKAENASLK